MDAYYRIDLSFNGAAFHGWQSQPSKNTVQDLLKEKISLFLGRIPVTLQGCSRTDATVHANHFVASFKLDASIQFSTEKMVHALNKMTAPHILVFSINKTDTPFHARFDAKAKTYTYVVDTALFQNPFTAHYTCHAPKCKDIDAILAGRPKLIGEHDFTSFATKLDKNKNPVRTIYDIDITQFNNYLCFSFTGNGFLYKMVRTLSGTLIQLGAGKLTPNDIKTILDSKNRSLAKITAPGHSLFLMKVYYTSPPPPFKPSKLPFQQ